MKGMQRKRKVSGNVKKSSNIVGKLDASDGIVHDHTKEIQPQKKLKYMQRVSNKFNINDNNSNIIINSLVASSEYPYNDIDLLACERGLSKITLNSTRKRNTTDELIFDDEVYEDIKIENCDVNDNVKGILRRCEKKSSRRKSVSFDAITDEEIKESHVYPKDKFHKKRKNQKSKKSGKNVSTKNTCQDTNMGQTSKILKASNYLNTWKYNREEWKFEKLMQTWIIKHMFNIEEVPNHSFDIFLEYMINIRGAARDLAIEYCQKVIRSREKDKSVDNVKSDVLVVDDTVYQRSRSLLQYIQ